MGRLTRDPELRYTNSNKATFSFSLAVEQDFVDRNGNRDADFPNCVVWNKPAETFTNLAHKGTMLSVTGRLSTRSYQDKNGNKRYVTEVIVSSYSMIDDYGQGRNGNRDQNNQQNGQSQNQKNGNFGNNNQNPNNQNGQYQNQNFGNNGNYDQQMDPNWVPPFADDQGNFRG
ncbi:hypothetical protein FC35_GL001116 [Limosilactobacillus coleohominis DSM 14060]|nr:hypothetical protein FC35_GL001116 [Limosilactobacillus coleohominis DSM 14060]